MDLVGGGRLGTGVKKSFLIGGPAAKQAHESDINAEAKDTVNEILEVKEDNEDVRVFCIEWAGM